VYFTLRGLADLPLLVLEVAGVHFTALHVGGQTDWIAELKPLLPFGRLPVMLDAAGNVIAQSASIVRHVVRFYVAGRGVQEEAQIDTWFEQVKELFGTHQTWGKAFNASALRHATPEELESASALHYRSTRNRGTYSQVETSLAALKTFEDHLQRAEGSGYLAGGEISYADLALFLQLWELLEEDQFPAAFDGGSFPALRAFVERVAALPRVAAYLASSRRMPRGVFDGKTYVFKPGRKSLGAAPKEEL
jgi:glutathione S-transferase